MSSPPPELGSPTSERSPLGSAAAGRECDADAARRQADFLAALNETTLDLLGRRNVPELLQALVTRASALLRSPHAEISLLEDGDLVVRAYSRGREYLAGDRVRRGEPAVSWRVIDTRAPVVTPCYALHPESRPVYRERGVGAAAVFPIVRGAECLGVLGLARDEPGLAYTAEDIREGLQLAQLAALVLHNAALHEEALRAAESRTADLRESEERFRIVFDRSPTAMGLVSLPDGRIVEINAACAATFGFSREEALGRSTLELGLWVDPALREFYLRRLQTEGSVHGFEAQMRRKDGAILTVLHSGAVFTVGGHTYTLSSVQDITARKHSEHARDRSLALMRATLEAIGDGVMVVGSEGRIETFNRRFAELWSLGRHVTPPADALPVLDDETEARVIHAILDQLVQPEQFIHSLQPVLADIRNERTDVLHCRDGRVIERTSRPQFIGRRTVGRVWSFRDVTESREAEAALRASEERFRVLAEVSPAGIYSTDAAGRCTFVNHRWCEFAGLTAEQALGDGWTAALHPDDRERVAATWGEAARSGGTFSAEYRFVRPDGTVTWLTGQARPQVDGGGQVIGYVGTVTDVTHLRRAEEERKRTEARQRQARKMESLGTLAGGIAHDFNNILTGTSGFVELARLELPGGHPAHAWLDRVATSCQRARELVRQILTFSRKNEGDRVPQRLQMVVAEGLRLLRSVLPPMVAIEPRIAADAPPVAADANQIHQLILNLCTNAWHAMPPRGGRVVVSLERCTIAAEQPRPHPDLHPGEWARLSVADNGCGMDAATLEQIFEPFFTTKESGVGTGLGLAVVHGIVKSHQGVILVRSAVGEGSTFDVYFPAVAPVPERPDAAPAPLQRGNGERVLVVDDDAISGFAIEKLVEKLGYQVTRCTRPEDALAQVARAPAAFDLVVTDLAMPGMNGAELIEHVTRVRADMPMIVVTGYLESERQRMLEKSPARAVLRKPVAIEELARVVAQNVAR